MPPIKSNADGGSGLLTLQSADALQQHSTYMPQDIYCDVQIETAVQVI